jgi:outer membrane protein assembly factor BamB
LPEDVEQLPVSLRIAFNSVQSVVHDTILTGEVDWCTTVHTDPKAAVQSVVLGQAWSGSKDGFGIQDDPSQWAGWLTATDASTGRQKWQFKASFPLMSGVTPTAGGLVCFGDMAFDLLAIMRTWPRCSKSPLCVPTFRANACAA